MKKLVSYFYIAFLCLTVVSCGGGGSGDNKTCSTLGAAIYNGDSCDSSSRSPVVAIRAMKKVGNDIVPAAICSGALITVDDIFTSAHCFVEPYRVFGSDLVGFMASVGDENIPIVGVKIPDGYHGNAGDRLDVALAQLERVPSPPIGPIPLLLSQLSLPGQLLTTFGYGTNNEGEVGQLKSAQIVIEQAVGGNLIASLVTSGASICQGDSGGPAVQVVNGITTLVGVNSFVSDSAEQCAHSGAEVFGFVDIQQTDLLDFIAQNVPDAAIN